MASLRHFQRDKVRGFVLEMTRLILESELRTGRNRIFSKPSEFVLVRVEQFSQVSWV